MTTGKIASDGIEFDIPGPDGDLSGEKVTLRHIHCDEFWIAGKIHKPKARDALIGVTDEYERQKILLDFQRTLTSYLVASWTLERECNQENAKQWLIDEPYLLDWIDRMTVTHKFFFGKASTN